VYYLETVLREELREDGGAPERAKNTAKPKSDYHLKKELESEKRKLGTRLRKALEEIAAHKKEREAIHEDFMEHPGAWSRQRNDRHEELGRLIESKENEWLELTQAIEKLNGNS